MKQQIVKNILTGLLLFIIIAAVLASASPLYRYLSARIETFKDYILDDITAKTGLEVSFKSMSPSVLNSIAVSEIVLTDSSSRLPVARVRKAYVKYSLKAALKNNMSETVRLITLDGVEIAVDSVKNSSLFSKIAAFVQPAEKPAGISSQTASVQDSTAASFSLPFPIKLRGVSVTLVMPDFTANVRLAQIFIRSDITGANGLIEMSGSAALDPSASVSAESIAQQIGHAYCSFSLKGVLLPGLIGSSVRLKINHLSNDSYSAVPLQIIAEYTQGRAELRLVQKVANVSAVCSIFFPDLAQGKTSAAAKTAGSRNPFIQAAVTAHSLDPFSLVRVSDKKNPLNILRGIVLSGDYSFSADSSFSSISYSALGSARVPKTLLPDMLNGPADAEYDIAGSLKSMQCRALNIKTRGLDMSYSGSINFETLQPEGLVTLSKMTLSNGNVIKNAELFIEPFQNGLFAVLPSVEIGSVPFNAVQLQILPEYAGKKITSVDYSAEFFTYDHTESDNPGTVSVSGSFIAGAVNQLQAEVVADNLYIDTLLRTAAFFADSKTEKTLQDAADKTPSYMMSGALYANTDFSGLTFNVPYIIAANTLKDKEVIVFSFDGNERSVRVSQFDALYAGQSAGGSFTVDFSPDYRDILFSCSLQINTIPYELNGSFMNGQRLFVTGNSGIELDAVLGGEKIAEGRLSLRSVPAAVAKYVLSVSAEIDFSFSSAEVWNASFTRLEISEPSVNIPLEPFVSLTGSADRYGCMVHSLQYRDTVSSLQGSLYINWMYGSQVLEHAQATITLADLLSKESYNAEVQISNPSGKRIDEIQIFEDLLFTAQADVNKTPLLRIDPSQKKESAATFSVSVLGTLKNPGGSVSVPSLVCRIGGTDLSCSGFVGMDDAVLTLSASEIQYGLNKITELSASFDLASFNGKADCLFEGDLGGEKVTTPAELYFYSDDSSKQQSQIQDIHIFKLKIPEMYTISAVLPSISSPYLGKLPRFDIAVSRIPGRFIISAGQKKQAHGWINDSGQCRFVMSPVLPLSLEVSGVINKDGIDLSIDKFELAADAFSKYVQFPFFSLHKGRISGSAHIGGLISDPSFTVNLTAAGVEASSPDYTPDRFYAQPFTITARENAIFFEKAHLFNESKKSELFVSLALNLDRWFFDSISIKLEVPQTKMVKGRFVMPYMNFEADVSLDLDFDIRLNSASVSGSIYADNAAGIFFPIAESAAQLAAEPRPIDENYKVNVDIGIMVGNHAQVFSPSKNSPLIRALVNPQTPISVKIDSAEDFFELKGDLILRGGEIKYFSRTFYLREGRLELNENTDKFDPVITVRAELRERDESGEMIRITLGAQKQSLSNLNPAFSSSPARSENEIMELLGQGFSDSLGKENLGLQLIASAVDLAGQFAIVRQVENRLREVSNFDIFSLQTSILQNAMFNYLESVTSDKKTLSPGNFFDNTAVYMGKYFGNSLYFDALFHLSYDENKKNETESLKDLEALVFQPEIGLEMAAPFAAIRWSLAPEIGADRNDWAKNLFVSSASISLSWKFSF